MASNELVPTHVERIRAISGRVRLHEKLHTGVPIESMEESDWLKITDEQFTSLLELISVIRTKLTEQTSKEPIQARLEQELNPDPGFQPHLQIMDSIWGTVYQHSPLFREYLAQQGISYCFLLALDHTHDYGRNFANARFRLSAVDSISSVLLKNRFAHFPMAYLHSIQWITGLETLPEDDAALTTAQRVGLMLKAVDTLGKQDAEGNYLDPDTLFAPEGAYSRWVAKQIENSRLPFDVIQRNPNDSSDRRRITITPERYAMMDEKLTRRGVRLLEETTGMSYTDIRERAQARLLNPPSPRD
ncbi:hypothetical protein KBD71_02055 [Candidatus Woesebacteria bacterium]|nr:hypothetical protein [Candidatus Woesebacteria bacterium]